LEDEEATGVGGRLVRKKSGKESAREESKEKELSNH